MAVTPSQTLEALPNLTLAEAGDRAPKSGGLASQVGGTHRHLPELLALLQVAAWLSVPAMANTDLKYSERYI